MIRRTLALAGVAALAAGFTGLAGPAAADPGIAALPDAGINEVAAELVDGGTAGDIQGGLIELQNNIDGNGTYNLAGHEIRACDAAGNLNTVVQFVVGDVIPEGSTFLIADSSWDPNASVTPNKTFISGSDFLRQPAGGVELVNGASQVDSVGWGMLNDTDCASFVPAGFVPTDQQSLNRMGETTWALRGATPEPL